jgi:pimeloyl-ACP methyl ester carboxylesterase
VKNAALLLVLPAMVAGCAYLTNVSKQSDYSAQQAAAPQQRVYKHLIEGDKYFVFGKLENGDHLHQEAMAVIAVSNLYQDGEIVDVNHFSRPDSYFGLNLPEGNYWLLVVSDLNRDGFYDETEVVGGRKLSVGPHEAPDKVLGEFDIDLNVKPPRRQGTLRLPVRKVAGLAESVFYPKGTIRALDDEIFSPLMGTLGLYEPAAFLEEAPMMFYALEEDLGYKVPVVFVHGIGGSARDFTEIVAQLDRSRYRPWFFYYPSGESLKQLSEMFYKLFLSGKVIPLEDMRLVIVAHSMGGLVVRDALNRCTGNKRENRVARLITIASPLGGHPGARNAVHAPLVLPSWRDLSPESEFIRQLHRRPLPKDLQYQLLYTYGNARTIKLGENSDGVVPLSSQLPPEAQNEAAVQFGFNDTHAGVLKNPEAIQWIIKSIEEVKAPYPEDHMREIMKGGYQVELGKDYTPMEKYVIHSLSHYIEALISGTIAPIHPMQTHFLQAIRGEKAPNNDVERAWIKFNKEYPDRSLLK